MSAGIPRCTSILGGGKLPSCVCSRCTNPLAIKGLRPWKPMVVAPGWLTTRAVARLLPYVCKKRPLGALRWHLILGIGRDVETGNVMNPVVGVRASHKYVVSTGEARKQRVRQPTDLEI